jgi:hypothetical protein
MTNSIKSMDVLEASVGTFGIQVCCVNGKVLNGTHNTASHTQRYIELGFVLFRFHGH